MKIPRRVLTTDASINMTPMIDVVFQLIIFFLLSSHLAQQEKQLPLPLPSAASGRVEAADERPRLTVNVVADGTLVVASRAIGTVDLGQLLGERRALHGDELEVRIRADRGVAYRRVEPVLLACAKAGIWNVAYVVQPNQ
jgi:biopolymer transport protein ExbD